MVPGYHTWVTLHNGDVFVDETDEEVQDEKDHDHQVHQEEQYPVGTIFCCH